LSDALKNYIVNQLVTNLKWSENLKIIKNFLGASSGLAVLIFVLQGNPFGNLN